MPSFDPCYDIVVLAVAVLRCHACDGMHASKAPQLCSVLRRGPRHVATFVRVSSLAYSKSPIWEKDDCTASE
ncbi:hypothetical protein N658DRAFT_499744 [Parathielavia hyrcaniae]|uniref:Uncharacterized protein n=1 Tax=Parathielavia hyrcaniae TaxID=113614 RepID=A0AAN6PY21_9PEZI|nr:hypothetical protein N658DRAFT_499744 [Parathielavia hyrcaniae]